MERNMNIFLTKAYIKIPRRKAGDYWWIFTCTLRS